MRRVGVVLAAGGSARFGSQKLLSDLAGRPLVWHAAETLRSAGLSVYVVVNDCRVASAAGAVDGVIYNPWWREGLSTSVKAAVVALHDADCIVWMLGDMPCVKPETVGRLASTCGKGLAVPVYRGRRGNPVASGRDVFPAALGISGDVGLRALLGLVPVSYIEVDDEGVLFDVDTPEDLQKASSCVRRSSRV
ncbi:MAG: NTP transferase domain-containing protein [Pyrobaculum arsenaticum]|uniref:Molybdenum cofactor cytidylyltransferase n=2 Tax=Pyrobaculum arsenaticum TaxID=121277 RepID=A4WMF0_PYRAR|nr:NTP transferase domain-containing protein [Pyrobaculum arsenaticum]ABP51567.1 molybdenum cofactor cytidylyltransferase [Pyrobaculum arsenaticum DSM 13514]MCY0891045.1 NTP transferase domain-containing protein [Pyrobaculum arsenaticum]NYR16464.1 NTP transferase domain-containing protein [Pyrobaculum arsenaticum]